MKLRKFAATSALVIAALGVTAGTAYADPAPAPSANSTLQTDIAPGIHYNASLVDHSVVITTDAGSLAARDGQFQVVDATGKVVSALPLSYQRDGLNFPIAAAIDGNKATLTPSTDRAQATPIADVHYVDATANPNFNQALSNLGNEVAIGVAVGSLIGTAIGAGIGCIAGGIVSGMAGAAVTIGTLAVPAALGGCLVTGAALGAMGAVAGTIFIGGPVAAVALFQFGSDLATPPAPATK